MVGAEFRGRVHGGGFGVLGPKFKRVFLVGVRGGGNEFGVCRNYEGREFDSRTRLVLGWAAWFGPSSEGGFIRGVFGVLGPKFKWVFLVGVSGDVNEFGVGRQRSALPGSAGKGACWKRSWRSLIFCQVAYSYSVYV